jgi:shikimate dehydrogenase
MDASKPQINAVIGYPLTHSKSPALHNALYKKLGINAAMRPLADKNIAKLVKTIKVLNIGLVAVTMPFKETIIPFLDSVDGQAKKMAAVNTIINQDNRLTGYNTDVDGVAGTLKRLPIKNKNVLLIGAGGAAKAVAYFIKSKGGKILYLNRTKTKALNLQKLFGGRIIKEASLPKIKIDVIINATSLGMYPKTRVSPLPNYKFNNNQTVFDVVYNPARTKLLTDAKKAGAKTISGLEMFIGQALRQIELYSGKIPDEIIKQYAKKILTKHL